MIASKQSHSSNFECVEELPLFLERAHLPSLYVKDSSLKNKDASRIVSLEEIVWIEGTVSVSF